MMGKEIKQQLVIVKWSKRNASNFFQKLPEVFKSFLDYTVNMFSVIYLTVCFRPPLYNPYVELNSVPLVVP